MSGRKKDAPLFAVVGKAPVAEDEPVDPMEGEEDPTVGIEERLRAKLKARAAESVGEGLSEDDAFGQTVMEFGGRTFRVTHPTLFRRKDIIRAMAVVQKASAEMEKIEDPIEQAEAVATLMDHQVRIVLPVLEIAEPPGLEFRAATLDDVLNHVSDDGLNELLAAVLPRTTPKAEMEKAGLDPK
ncbi:MAG: hypothetical protein M3Y56_07930 [Armatimonadota bacterium]|nr:hypothetical protein [Armatimonadota bacterium]